MIRWTVFSVVLEIFLLNLLEDGDSWGSDFFIPLIFAKGSPPQLFRDRRGHVTRPPAFLPGARAGRPGCGGLRRGRGRGRRGGRARLRGAPGLRSGGREPSRGPRHEGRGGGSPGSCSASYSLVSNAAGRAGGRAAPGTQPSPAGLRGGEGGATLRSRRVSPESLHWGARISWETSFLFFFFPLEEAEALGRGLEG